MPQDPTELRVERARGCFNLIQAAVWPTSLLIVGLLLFYGPIGKRLREVGYGSFQLKLTEQAERSGLGEEVVRDLQGLSYPALRLFLIIGGDRSEAFKFSAPPDMVREEYYKELADRDLIQVVRVSKPGDPDFKEVFGEKGAQTTFSTTVKGSASIAFFSMY